MRNQIGSSYGCHRSLRVMRSLGKTHLVRWQGGHVTVRGVLHVHSAPPALGPHVEWAVLRGFSFQQDGPLDMRMDTRQALTAAQLLNDAGVEQLARIFRDLGEEPEARRLARVIEQERRFRRFETTRQLAELIERLKPSRGNRIHPATRVFQALRMAVNDEIDSLQRGLEAALRILKPGGRLIVITFHSVEDRVVKAFGRERSRDYVAGGGADIPELRQPAAPALKWMSRKAIPPGAEEIAANPRARSAHLRVMEKI